MFSMSMRLCLPFFNCNAISSFVTGPEAGTASFFMQQPPFKLARIRGDVSDRTASGSRTCDKIRNKKPLKLHIFSPFEFLFFISFFAANPEKEMGLSKTTKKHSPNPLLLSR